jgi:hypothetical protein
LAVDQPKKKKSQAFKDFYFLNYFFGKINQRLLHDFLTFGNMGVKK